MSAQPNAIAEACSRPATGPARGASFRGRRRSMARCRLLRSRARMANGKGEAGFTLVEVIVALAMLSLGLSVLLAMISSGLGRTASAGRMAEAGSLAQSLLAEVGTELPIKTEERNGLFSDGYRWHLTMRLYDNTKEREERPIGLYQISAEIAWDEGTERRSFTLSTLRFGAGVQRP
jgi:general secretion pathway protein I